MPAAIPKSSYTPSDLPPFDFRTGCPWLCQCGMSLGLPKALATPVAPQFSPLAAREPHHFESLRPPEAIYFLRFTTNLRTHDAPRTGAQFFQVKYSVRPGNARPRSDNPRSRPHPNSPGFPLPTAELPATSCEALMRWGTIFGSDRVQTHHCQFPP